eukprot:TRINITY_DN1117_c0_g1_i10.p1 TRINITY_DN1117_c0_g1~~TRINITY_DN1117_c0_g1_i10.p1  ORF type:complete len:319 (+),score=54.24 TRINITY_DN1117_c0_g1_i10:433-1389(+)
MMVLPRFRVGLKPSTRSLLHYTARSFCSNTSANTNPHIETKNDTTSSTTHFGFQTVSSTEKESLVGEVFKRVSQNYDVMNDAMSLGIHRLWKDKFVNTLNPTPGTKLLDVAGGTGDIAFRCIEKIRSSPIFFPKPATTISTPTSNSVFSSPTHVTICDINPSMLSVGKKRAAELGYENIVDPTISWVEGNAESLPFESESMDAYTIAFGIRNVTHIENALKEAHRVLKKGGRFLCLEFSQVNNPLLRAVYDKYSFEVIPVMGQLIANDFPAYQYLVESIRKFPNQETFASLIEQAGFKMVTYEDLTFGVVAIHSGWKL